MAQCVSPQLLAEMVGMEGVIAGTGAMFICNKGTEANPKQSGMLLGAHLLDVNERLEHSTWELVVGTLLIVPVERRVCNRGSIIENWELADLLSGGGRVREYLDEWKVKK